MSCQYVCVCVLTTNPGSKLRIWFVLDFAFCVSEWWMYVQYCGFGVTGSGFERQSEDENEFLFFFFLGLRCGINPASHIKFDIYLKWKWTMKIDFNKLFQMCNTLFWCQNHYHSLKLNSPVITPHSIQILYVQCTLYTIRKSN